MLYEDYEDDASEENILAEIEDKKRKAKSKEINVMNKKKLSRWELDEYMSDVDDFNFFE